MIEEKLVLDKGYLEADQEREEVAGTANRMYF